MYAGFLQKMLYTFMLTIIGSDFLQKKFCQSFTFLDTQEVVE